MGPFVIISRPNKMRTAVHYTSIVGVEEARTPEGEFDYCLLIVRVGNEVRQQRAVATLEEVLELIKKARDYDLGTLILPSGDVLT